MSLLWRHPIYFF